MAKAHKGALAALIESHCRELRLVDIRRQYKAIAREARDADWDYEEFLMHALESEVKGRRERASARLLRQARFPEPKSLEQLDFDKLKGISRHKLFELATCEFIEKAETVVLAGPIGTGKTHIAISLGVEAVKRRFKVAFCRTAELVRILVEARDERRLQRLHERFRRVSLLIVDELGFVPFSAHEGELLFNLLVDRYERRATIVTTNLAFSEWVEVFKSEKLTTALLDRLAHHSHILTTRGKSFRTRLNRNVPSHPLEPETPDESCQGAQEKPRQEKEDEP